MMLQSLICLTLALCQAPPPREGQGPRGPAYDVLKEKTIQGTVQEVQTQSFGPGRMVTVTLQVEGERVRVMVGPQEVLKRQGLTLAEGDSLTVVGAATEGPDGGGFMARQVTRGDLVVTLLDAQGRPAGEPQRP